MTRPRLILASASPRRRALLEQIGAIPDAVVPADLDEALKRGELAPAYAARLGEQKARAVAIGHPDDFVLGCDTVVAVGRRILPKAEEKDDARRCLSLISGRSHRVYSGLCLAQPDGRVSSRLVETRVKVRRLEDAAITEYLTSDEWRGKAGGYAIQGLFAQHVIQIIGSYPNVVGLPLYETANLLYGAGWRP